MRSTNREVESSSVASARLSSSRERRSATIAEPPRRRAHASSPPNGKCWYTRCVQSPAIGSRPERAPILRDRSCRWTRAPRMPGHQRAHTREDV
jgi:hypothetical protein